MIVSLNGKTNLDYFMDLVHREISSPSEKRITANIQGADGSVDFTDAVFGGPRFENRDILMRFEIRRPRNEWQNVLTKLYGDLSGKTVRVIFSDDPYTYREGRCRFDKQKDNGSTMSIECHIDSYPFKKNVDLTDVGTYAAPSYGNITITINCKNEHGIPEFSIDSSAQFTIYAQGETWTLDQNTRTPFGLRLDKGDNIIMANIGTTGNLTVKYRGEDL